MLKLNLGCGEDHKPGYVNVDKYGNPDLIHDLEKFPWPWEDCSVGEILLKHVIEHLGERTETYLNIVKELYRICCPGAKVYIMVPHPRHDDFSDDPTHVRMVTPQGLSLFSKRKNHEWIERGFSNTPLGIYLDVDFEIINVEHIFDPVWAEILKNKDNIFISQAIKRYNNVVREIRMIIKALK